MPYNLPSGIRLVSSTNIPEPRKSKAELARMSIESRILYEASHPLSESEKWDGLRREYENERYELDDEILVGSRLHDDGPDDVTDDHDVIDD